MIFSFINTEKKNNKNYYGNLPILFNDLISSLKINKHYIDKLNLLFSFSFTMHNRLKFTIKDVENFKLNIKKCNFDLNNIIPHSDFRINIASSNDVLKNICFQRLYNILVEVAKLGISHVNIHLGSNENKKQGFNNAVNIIKKIFTKAKEDKIKIASLCLENSVKQGNKLLVDLNDYIYLYKSFSKPFFDANKLFFCIDTCHLFASGINLNDFYVINNFFSIFDKEIGFNYLKLIHLNGSLFPLKSGYDRHSNFQNSFLQSNDFFYFIKKKLSLYKDIVYIMEFPQKSNAEWNSNFIFLLDKILY
jgi:deoxyribonuclease IV